MERLTQLAPDIDIYIIPDSPTGASPSRRKAAGGQKLCARDVIRMALVLSFTVGLALLLDQAAAGEATLLVVFMFGVLLSAQAARLRRQSAQEAVRAHRLEVLFKTSQALQRAVAAWVYKNGKHAGASTGTLPGARCLYMAVRGGNEVYAVIGMALAPGEALESFEKNLLIAMFNEFALALERERLRSE